MWRRAVGPLLLILSGVKNSEFRDHFEITYSCKPSNSTLTLEIFSPSDKNCQGGDPLPMLLTMPRLMDYEGGSNLLGLGDIVLPGLLISYAARFDAAKSMLGVMRGGNGSLTNSCPKRKYCASCSLCTSGYFWPLVVAYGIGLSMANMAVYLMRMGQPALLYLVPCCLGTFCVLGWQRGEFADLWDSPRAIRAADDIIYGESESAPPSSNHAPVSAEEGEMNGPDVPSAQDDDDADAAGYNNTNGFEGKSS